MVLNAGQTISGMRIKNPIQNNRREMPRRTDTVNTSLLSATSRAAEMVRPAYCLYFPDCIKLSAKSLAPKSLA